MGEIYVQIVALLAVAVTGILIAAAIGRRMGWLSFRVLAILSYTLVIPISGIAHLARGPDSQYRGPYDALNGLDTGQMAYVVVVAGSGLAALVVGTLVALPTSRVKRRTSPLTPDDRKTLPLFIAAILPVSIWALQKTREYVAGLDVFGGRVISVSGGNARYTFVSYWAVWAISLGVIWFVLQRRESKPLMTAIVFFGGAAACAVVVDWAGGRSDALLAAVPMALVLFPLVRAGQLTTLLFGSFVAIGGAWQVAQLTARRSAVDPYGGSGLAGFVDWEFGRFSMLGWATQYTEQTGFLYGETLVSGGLRLVSGLQKLLGLPAPDFVARASQRVATEDLDRARAGILDYINPSVMAEMYLNFGFLGAVGSLLVIGVLSGYCDRQFLRSKTAVVQLAWGFIGLTVAVSSHITESFTPVVAILYRGAPLVFIAALSASMARSSATFSSSEPGGGGQAKNSGERDTDAARRGLNDSS
ncbi:MAG: hypothetical protein FGM52_01150 [Mycobacterium sp.]|nr:hypothetical protein [Mycobacterium sp.]